jgi:glycosyltransferase involved in cell wall biosynthesis
MLDLACGLRERGLDVAIGLPGAASALRRDARAGGFTVVDLHAFWDWDAHVAHIHLHNTLDRRALALVPALRTATNATIVTTEHLPRAPSSDPSLGWGPRIDAAGAFRKPGARHAKTGLKRLQAAAAHRIICVSAHSRRFVMDRYGIPGSRVRVVHNGVPVPAEAPDAPAGPLEVVVVGTVCWRKGSDVMLEAVERSARPWRVRFIGDGDERETLERRAACTVTGRVEFCGWVSDPAKAQAAGHLVCLPSRAESFPYSALEAMALGRAVVGARVDGVPEMVADGTTGMLVTPGDAAELARVLDRLYDHPGQVAEMGCFARAMVGRRFTLDRMVASTIEVYRELRRA